MKVEIGLINICSMVWREFCGLESAQSDINIANHWCCRYDQYLQQHWIWETQFLFTMLKGDPLPLATPDKILDNI